MSNITNTLAAPMRQSGTSMIEILVTIVILAIGMLGLAGLQVKVQNSEMEAYQRAQALVIMNDMVERLTANRDIAASYASTNTAYGGAATLQNCSLAADTKAKDLCEWGNILSGAAETLGTDKIGAMINARGCIQQIQAANSTAGVCTPAVYEVSVAWQGLSGTFAPNKNCGKNGFFGVSGDIYGSDDTLRRTVTTQITLGLPSCV